MGAAMALVLTLAMVVLAAARLTEVVLVQELQAKEITGVLPQTRYLTKTPVAGAVQARLAETPQTVFSMLVGAVLGQPTIIETVLTSITLVVAAVAAVTAAVMRLMGGAVVVAEVDTRLLITLELQVRTAFLIQEAAAAALVVRLVPSTKRKRLAAMAVQASL